MREPIINIMQDRVRRRKMLVYYAKRFLSQMFDFSIFTEIRFKNMLTVINVYAILSVTCKTTHKKKNKETLKIG
jgi:hypothetical protein